MAIDNRIKPEDVDTQLDNLDQDLDAEVLDADTDTQEDDDEDEIQDAENTEDDVKADPTKDAKDIDPDYKEKFKASTQEAQVLTAQRNKMTETIEKAASITDVEEAELKSEYPDWEKMTPIEQKLAKSDLINRKRFSMINDVVMEGKKIDEWGSKVDTFLEDDTQTKDYPGLVGRESEFKNFAMKPTRRGLEMGDLVSAFLYQVPMTQKKQGSLLMSGRNSADYKPSSSKLSADDAAMLRRKSPREYMEAVKHGKIEDDI